MSLVPRADPEFDDWEPLWPLEPEPTDWWEPLEPLEPVPTGWHSTQWRNGQWQPVWNPPFLPIPPPRPRERFPPRRRRRQRYTATTAATATATAATMPPPNTPEEGGTAPTSRPASPVPVPVPVPFPSRPPSPQPSSAVACASRGGSALVQIDYQSLEYVGEVDDTLLCPICRTPLYSPITTPCGHTFCAGCINRALEVQPTCPIDRQPVNKTRDYRNLPLIIKDQLDRLRVRCPNPGCGHECAREHLEAHYERRCDLTPVRCPDRGCAELVARRHARPENGCMHRPVPCPYCGDAVPALEMDAHHDRTCDAATADCELCAAAVVRRGLNKHRSDDCPEAQARCRWHAAGCRVADKRRAVREHEEGGCMFEAVGRLLQEQAENRRIMEDLASRLASIEMRARRREQRREQRTDASSSSSTQDNAIRTFPAPAAAAAGGGGGGDMIIPSNTAQQAPVLIPDLLTGPIESIVGSHPSPLDVGHGSAPAPAPAATTTGGAGAGAGGARGGAWGSPEDYVLAQCERMEAQMEDLRKKMTEMDAGQSLALLQTNARLNEQLAELASKVGVLNMHTTWLLNMQRQTHAQQQQQQQQQRSATASASASAAATGPGANNNAAPAALSHAADRDRGAGGGGAVIGRGYTAEQLHNEMMRQRPHALLHGDGRRNSDDRGEHPSRL